MDKQSSKVTVKINGNEKGYEEKKETKKSGNQSFSWVLPPEQPVKKKVVHMEEYRSEVERKKGNSFKVKGSIIAVLVAIVVGSIFGFILLNVVGKSSLKNGSSLLSGTSVNNGGEITIRPLQFYALQGGVYSSQKAALEDQKRIEDNGIGTAIIQQENKWFILLGIFDKKEKSGDFQQFISKKGIATFGKVFIVSGGQVKGEDGVLLSNQRLLLEKLIGGTLDKKLANTLVNDVDKTNNGKAFSILTEQYIDVADKGDNEKTQSTLLKLIEMYSTFKK